VKLEGNGQYVLIAMILASIMTGSGSLPYWGLGISLDYGRNGLLAVFFMPGRFLSAVITNMSDPNLALAIGLNLLLYGLFFYFVIRPRKAKRAR
jgi:hypothetical protein